MKNNIKVTIEKFDVDWKLIKNLCRSTFGMDKSDKEPSQEWKRKLLVARHSPIRQSNIVLKIEGISYSSSVHICRHHQGIEKFVTTSREDRTGIDRSTRKQTDPVTMYISMNIEALLNISQKRLCNQASKETREVWQMVVNEVSKYDDDIAWACCPEGIHQASCPESFGNCDSCVKFLNTLDKEQLLNLKERLNAYNEYRNEKILKIGNK